MVSGKGTSQVPGKGTPKVRRAGDWNWRKPRGWNNLHANGTCTENPWEALRRKTGGKPKHVAMLALDGWNVNRYPGNPGQRPLRQACEHLPLDRAWGGPFMVKPVAQQGKDSRGRSHMEEGRRTSGKGKGARNGSKGKGAGKGSGAQKQQPLYGKGESTKKPRHEDQHLFPNGQKVRRQGVWLW